MLYKDIFTLNAGLFKEIFFKDLTEQYKELFGELDPLVLDSHANYHYSDKPLLNKIDLNNYKDYIKNIILFNYNIWKTQKELLNLTYDITNPLIEKTTKTGYVIQDNKNNNVNIESATAFNDANFKDNGKTETKENATRKEEYNIENTRSGANGNNNITTDIQKEINFRKQNFYREIIKDIVSSLTKKVY